MSESNLAAKLRQAQNRNLTLCFGRLFLEDYFAALDNMLQTERFQEIFSSELTQYADSFVARCLHQTTEEQILFRILIEPFAAQKGAL